MKSRALSTTGAELMGASEATREAVHLIYLLEEKGFPQGSPIVIKIDSTAAIAIAKDPVQHDTTKHLARRHLYVRDMIAENVVVPEVVASADNRSDIFTKPLARKPFQKLRNAIMGHIP